ncbi:MAG: PAS domain S-box protein [Verrucomicrobiota bacterium]
MTLRDMPIRRKLMLIILLTCGMVMLLMRGSFFIYEYMTYRQALVRQLTMLSEVIASNSTAALAFDNPDDARDTLGALRAERHVVAAALYDANGRVFASYPDTLTPTLLPADPGPAGNRFEGSDLLRFQPVVQKDRRLGTLYLRFDSGANLRDFIRGSLPIAGVVMAVILLAAYLLSRTLQRQISEPILALAGTARAIAEHNDYSVRATNPGSDELGLLTDAFNRMLVQIHAQNQVVRESEGRMRAVLDAAISAVVVIDRTGRIIDWNARAERMFGWTRADILGRTLTETIIPPRHRAAHQRGLEHYLATGEGPVLNRLVELSALRRDGREFPVELSISPLQARDTLTFCGFITDLTERKQAEEAVRSSQHLLQAIIDNSTAVIYVKDLEGRYLLLNRRYEELFHVGRKQLAGKTDYDVFPAAVADAFRAFDRQVLAAGKALEAEEIAPHADGPHTYLSIKCPLFDAEGKPYAVCGISTDITERKQAEERLQASLKDVNDLKAALDEHAIVAITNPQGRITYVNDKFCAISKYRREELLGQDHRIINSGHHPKEFIRDLWATIARGRVWKGELKNRAKDGSIYWVDTTIVPFLKADGKPYQYVAIRADITQRKLVEEEIRRLNQELEARVAQRTSQLEAANKELEAFSYSVSHDLRAPLRHIDGFAGLLLKTDSQTVSERGKRHLTNIADSAKQMGRLIDDLLVFSRMGRADMNIAEVNLSSMVEETIRSLQPEVQQRKVVWQKGPLPTVQADPPMLRQVFVNLLSNAVKYTRPRNPAVIEIGSQEGSSEVVIHVRDNGVGFEMAYADKLFGVFQRLHRAEDFEGTGIGLANVRRIVIRHGGRTWAEGRPDAGATFYFSLPKSRRPIP